MHKNAFQFINNDMSFYSDPNNISPGRIDGSPTEGLRHRAAVFVERVLYSAIKQERRENVKLAFKKTKRNTAPTSKCTFIGAKNSGSIGTVTNLSVTRIEERKSFARVKCTVTIPMLVEYKDEAGKRQKAKSEIKACQDVILYVPEQSVFPFEVKAVAGCNCPGGKFADDGSAMVTACITVVIKITAQTDLLIPTYGFVPTPRAIEYEKNECDDYFDLPLYPSGK